MGTKTESASLVKHYRQLLGIARNWALRQVPGWGDESHRDLLARHGATMVPSRSRISATTMNVPQLDAALNDYERMGWPRRHGVFQQGRVAQTVPPRIAKLVRQWALLGDSGKIHNAKRAGLMAWCGRQLGRTINRLDDLTPEQCQALTEMLKRWLERPAEVGR